MKKVQKIVIGIIFSATFISVVIASQVLAQSIPTLDQFTSTTTPISAITQRTYGKAIKITGLTTGLCLTLDSNKLLTTTACGSTSQWTTTGSDIYYNTGKVSVGSTTPWAQLSVNPNALGSGVPEFAIGSSSATHFVVDGAGNIGTGSTTPWAQLSVNPNGITGPEFAIGSSTRTDFVVTNGGNVGIGSTTPWATLAVNPTAGRAANQFVVGSFNATNFVVTNTGNVGVGTVSPNEKLEIGGTNSKMRLPLPGSGKSGVYFGGTAWGFELAQSASTYYTDVLFDSSGGSGGNSRGIRLMDTNGSTVRLFVGDTGNVGIGTTSPWAQLSLNPSALGSGVPEFAIGSTTSTHFVVTGGGNVGIGTTTPWATLAVNPTAGNASNQFVVGSSTATNFIITNAGSVGVGTSSPYAKLSIQSNSNTGDAFTVATSSGAAVAGYDNDGHYFTSGPAPSVTCNGVGTATLTTSDDQQGIINTNTLATQCTLTFSKAYRISPIPNGLSDSSTAITPAWGTINTTSAVINLSAGLTGTIYYSFGYHY